MDAQAKEIKNKVVCEINSFVIVYFFFDDRLIKQQTAWSQGSSKYQKQKKCTRSENSINLSCYVYIIPKETIILQNQIKQKENGYNLKIGH
jgi:hypothetical protein